MSTGKRATLAIGVAIVGTAVATLTVMWAPAVVQGDIEPNSIETVKALSNAFSVVAENASPAVVFIEVQKELERPPALFFGPGERGHMNPFGFPIPRQFGEPEETEPRGGPVMMGQGSGFIISTDGYIATNNHVVGGADKVRVSLPDGRSYTAEVVGTDPQTEIALIKIDAKDLPTVKLGDSDQLRVGDWVLTIGSPFGLSHTVTSGIVSARGRGDVGIVDYSDFIQTDAAINPGSSGGPLLDIDGNVVGMATAIVSRGGGSDGIGFAIPVNMVKYVIDQIQKHGSVSRGYLGVYVQELTPELAKWFDIEKGQGVLVAEVQPDSPAARAGLERDDVIVELNGKTVGEAGAFRSQISTTPSGSEIELGILRNGSRITKHVEVGQLDGKKPEPEIKEAAAPKNGKLGMMLQPLTDDVASRLGYKGETGVIVAQVVPGSPAAFAGIRPGSLIQEVNKKRIENIEEFQKAVSRDKTKGTLLRVKEGESSRYVVVDTA